MSHDEHVYKQALLSSSSLDHDNESDSTMRDEKIAALDDYERKAARTRMIRAGALLSSVILNLVLLISLGALYARLHSSAVWRGVKPVWSTSSLCCTLSTCTYAVLFSSTGERHCFACVCPVSGCARYLDLPRSSDG